MSIAREHPEITRDLAAARAVAERFASAAAAGDKTAARLACTEAGWEDGDSPVRGLFMQASKKGLVLDPMGEPRKLGKRASQRIVLSHPKAPRPLGDLWLLLAEGPTETGAVEWRVVGATKLRPHVGLFLWGHLGGTLSVADLERSEAAETWAEEVLTGLQDGVIPDIEHGSDLLKQRLQPDDVSVTTLKSAALPEIHRAAVGFRFTTPDDDLGYDVWLILGTATRDLAVVHAAEFLTQERLFHGIDVDWPHEDQQQPGRALVGTTAPGDAETGRIVLEELVRKLLVAAGADPAGLPEDDPRREKIGELFAALRRMAPRKGEDPTAPPTPADPDAPTPLQLQPEVEERLREALDKLQQRKPDDTGRSAEQGFAEDHGAELVGSIFSALFKMSNPKGIPLVVPEAAPDAAPGETKVRMKIDPMAILGDALSEAAEE
jgi:hypothetical protein